MTEFEPPRHEVMDHWAYPGVVVMRELGMASGGYLNDYRLEDDVANRWALQFRINRMMSVINECSLNNGEFQVPAWEVSFDTDAITVSQLFFTAAQCASLGDRMWLVANNAASGDAPVPMTFASADEARNYLIWRGVLDTKISHHFNDMDAIATNGQLLYTLGSLYKTLMES